VRVIEAQAVIREELVPRELRIELAVEAVEQCLVSDKALAFGLPPRSGDRRQRWQPVLNRKLRLGETGFRLGRMSSDDPGSIDMLTVQAHRRPG
jgi:hypothetical protein